MEVSKNTERWGGWSCMAARAARLFGIENCLDLLPLREGAVKKCPVCDGQYVATPEMKKGARARIAIKQLAGWFILLRHHMAAAALGYRVSFRKVSARRGIGGETV